MSLGNLHIMAGRTALRQMMFTFLDAISAHTPLSPKPTPDASPPVQGRDEAMETQCREWLLALGLKEGAQKVQVIWNSKLRSTAGYARWPQWRVELNPRLKEFEGQVDRTLKHELAHLVAYARSHRRRIEPHGAEWRQACIDLGIPDESARHTLPLPRTRQERKLLYKCLHCGFTVERVRKFRRYSACLPCCRKHNEGRYDARFQFVLQKKG